ncbi:hypothetical protein BT63DRAFT_93205 [Microthyrium microscopicum]|uniref:AA9 family lytic polysaccharide monooxygenase n=1 Tax=Microthyrium microscopicum TaxID=703497 RepID=A0A6A6TWW0_9PEZI|nr:hypothetical protein BT63DRAFT_93205 [Microthyrium microscopicum]
MQLPLLFSALAASANAHYFFSQLLINGQPTGRDFTYIRKISTNPPYNPAFPDMLARKEYRCNNGANLGTGTQTISIAAGTKIGARLGQNNYMGHPGPGFIMMSKASSNASSYDGSGDWFKIWESGLKPGGQTNHDNAWETYGKKQMEATIPATTPPGEYLVRFEHVGIHENHKNKSQMYFECAQVKVTGAGGGTPGPMFKIPGVITASSPMITFSKWGPAKSTFPMPAPAVWTGQ